MDKSFKLLKTASAKLQSQINTSIIFNYINSNAPISRNKISEDLKISRPSVSRIVEGLIKNSYVIETGKLKTKSGKRPTLLEINDKKGFVIGIDLGKEKLKIAITNLNGRSIERYIGFKISNNKNIDKKLIIEIRDIINKWGKKSNLDKNTLSAICIGVPANIDIETGKIISAPLYENWKDLNLKEILGKEFDVPVFIENDVNLSALGEKYYGRGRKFKDFVFMEISNGIGTGIIINNHIFRGSYGSAGEIGFTVTNPDDLGSKVKNKGFLEKFASVESIGKEAVKKIKEGGKTLITDLADGDIKKIKPSVVCHAAIRGDYLANNTIGNMVNLLSMGLINLVLILNPQIIVIGGDISNLPEADKLFVKPIVEKVKSSIPFKIPEIEISDFGGNAGIVGASFHAIESLIMSEFPYRIEEGVTT